MQPCLSYREHTLYMDQVSLADIAECYGTPCYVYSADTITKNWRAFATAFAAVDTTICYAVKANSNLAILHLLARLGSGFDIVSIGELERVITAGGDPNKIIFSGVGKQEREIKRAIELNIHCIDVESIPELQRVNRIANRLDKTVNIALRVNPNVDANTHAHITTGRQDNKFGINIENVADVLELLPTLTHVSLTGVAAHIGSQITSLEPFVLALEQLLNLYHTLSAKDIPIQSINLGGGLGITYQHEAPPSLSEYAHAIIDRIQSLPLKLYLEPGRTIIANAGVLLTRVEYIKETSHKNFAIVDAGMNDLLRPALYNAWQPIFPVNKHSIPLLTVDIAGPVCESADFLGKERELAISENDVLAVGCAGAYGASMSSNYNSRCRAAEVLITDNKHHLIRQREIISDLFTNEMIPSFDLV